MSPSSGRPQAADGQRRKPARGATASRKPGTAGSNSRPRRRSHAVDPRVQAANSVRAAEQQRALSLEAALTAALEVPPPPPTTFAEIGIPAALVAALADHGIREPFAIQARAMPDALAGRDVLGRAQTGSGKTLAFGLPVLARLAGQPAGSSRQREGAPRALILVPTRELALQVAEVLEPLGRSLRISVMTVYGGVSITRQIDRLRRGVDVVVATPGRLLDVMDRGACTLDDISITVIDEADHMADLGFLPPVTRILDATPAVGQRLLFSATLDRGVAGLVTSHLTEPALHAVPPAASTEGEVAHQVFVLPAADKLAVATDVASREGRTLIFVRTKHGADRLARQLTKAGVSAAAIHGNLSQNQRQRALNGFTDGRPRVLVATNVAARGIHVDDIGLVVHYDPPADHKDYLHRSGRTARAGAAGAVLVLADPSQVREVGKMHDAAGVTPVSHHVTPGDQAVRELARSGTRFTPTSSFKASPASAPHRDLARKRPPRSARRTHRTGRAPNLAGGRSRG